METQQGQATVDYVALVALLAVVLAGALAAMATIGGPGVANAVLGQFRHALCIVTGRSCAVQRQLPCTVASRKETRRIAVTIVLVRLSRDSYVLREQLSDGTVRLTVFRRYGAGAEGGVGGRLEIDRKDDPGDDPAPVDLVKKPPGGQGSLPDAPKAGLSAEARAALEGIYGSGKVFIAGDDREADEILRAVRADDDTAPAPREVFYEGGVRGLARAGFGGLLAGAQLDGVLDTTLGVRRNRESGGTTITLSSGSAGSALISAAMAGPAGALDRQVVLGVQLDREGRSVELSVMAAGGISGGGSLSPRLVEALGGAEGWSRGLAGRRWEVAARLDLTDPEVATAWSDFRRNPASPAAIAALGDQLRRRAHLDVRAYETDSGSDGFAAGIAAGLRLGGETDRTTDRARLLKASTRPPGGLWEQRLDCLAEVA